MSIKALPNFGYIAAALTLAGFAAHASSVRTLTIAGGCFICVAAALAVLQIKGWVDPPPGGLVLFGASLVGVAALLGGLFVIWHRDGLPVFAGTIAYLGAGWLVLGLRCSPKGHSWRSPVLLGSGIGLLIAGLLLLPIAESAAFACLLLSIVALLPIGLNVASEDAVWLRNLHPTRRRVAVLAGGLAVAAVVAIVLGLFSHAPSTALVASAAAVVLLASIVSRTHLDTAIALTLLVLVSAAPPETRPSAVPVNGQGEQALIAVGDSFMSGEGTSLFYAGTDNAGGDECRRSPHAYAAEVGTDKRYFGGLTFVACSGAIASNVLVTPPGEKPVEQYEGQRTQLDELSDIVKQNPAFRASLIAVSIGGNDAGFARIGEACLAPGSCRDVRQVFTQRLDVVEQHMELVYRQLHELFPGTTVVAVPYPAPIKDEGSCGQLMLRADERTFVRTFLDQLDDRINQAAQATGTRYLAEMKTSLADAGLQLCDPANHDHAGINFVMLNGQAAAAGGTNARFNPIKWTHDSLHPNDRGHAAMAVTFRKWLDAHRDLLSTGDYAVGSVPPVSHAGLDTRTAELRSVRTWEGKQVRNLTPWILLLLVGAGGLWTALIVVAGRAGTVSAKPDAGPGGA